MVSRRPRKLNHYVLVVSRRKLLVLAPVLVLSLATASAVRGLMPLYESNAVIAIGSPTAPGATYTTPQSSDRFLPLIRQQLSDHSRVEQIMGKCGLGHENTDDLISKTKASIRVSASNDSDRKIVISFRAVDPEIAQCVATELAASIVSGVERKEQASDIDDSGALTAHAAELAGSLRELERSNSWLLSQERIPTLPTRATSPQARQDTHAQQLELESVKDQKYKLDRQLADVTQRIAAQRQIVEQQKKGAPLRDNPTYAVLVAKRTELQGQRDTLMNRQELTDKHPRVAAITDHINAINREIEELRQQDSGSVRQSPEARELNSLESDRNRLSLELELNARELARRTSGRAATSSRENAPSRAGGASKRSLDASRIADEYEVLKLSYAKVTAQLRAAEAPPKGGDSSAGLFSLVQPPELPRTPVSPNRWLFVLLGGVAGLVVGLSFAVMAESRRLRSLQDSRDVEFYTRLPLLASIPKTTGPAEGVARKRANVLRLALGAATAALATFILGELIIFFDVFSMIGKR